jgi:hypothetical protein
MPYFVYKIFPGRKLEYVSVFEKFPEAKNHAKEMRKALAGAGSGEDDYTVKVMFAKNQTEAEMQLKEEREYRPQGDD